MATKQETKVSETSQSEAERMIALGEILADHPAAIRAPSRQTKTDKKIIASAAIFGLFISCLIIAILLIVGR